MVKPKFDWYESDQFVVLNILIKQIDPNAMTIKYEPKRFLFRYEPNGSDGDASTSYQLDLNLFGEIVPSESLYRVSSVKVEVKLHKVANARWSKLESEVVCLAFFLFSFFTFSLLKVCSNVEDTAQNSKCKSFDEKMRQWDSIAKELGNDESDSVDDLFKKIYSTGDDNLRKAMMKSFVESNGTVLSTNWDEVSRSKVEMKPPESSEFKKW